MPSQPQMSDETKTLILRYQRDEATDHLVYRHLAKREKIEYNRQLLQSIAASEKEHEEVWAKYTGGKVSPQYLRAFWYIFISYIFGYTFTIKLMEKGEYATGQAYQNLAADWPEIQAIIKDEQNHERQLAEMMDEERLKYVGAMVLGLNDALVELSGAIAGLTLALADNRLVALTGIITGVAATLSMASSNYLAEKANGRDNAIKSSFYTGMAYLITVICLVAPYLLLPPTMYFAALFSMLVIVILIILIFNYYVAVAKSLPFKERFFEMAAISLGVALISFIIGLLAKHLLGVEV